jgi:hypothetical protein
MLTINKTLAATPSQTRLELKKLLHARIGLSLKNRAVKIYGHMATQRLLLVALVSLACCSMWVYPASDGVTVTNGCSPLNKDTSPWFSVTLGHMNQDVLQFWLSQSYAYMTHSE